MHDYAIFGHDRTVIGRWLGIISITVAGGIAQLITALQNLTGIEAFTKATITTGITYFCLHLLFNKYCWKIPFFQIPDVSGEWCITGQTLNESGATVHEWSGSLGIEQTWKNISIHLKTENSQSYSYTATLLKKPGPIGGWLLSYSYKNDPEVEKLHELNSHKGYCEIDFNKDISLGKASYFNSASRRTFGIINLTRI